MKILKWSVSVISIFLFMAPAQDLFGKDQFIKFTDRQSRDSRIYAPPAQSKTRVFRDTSPADPSVYVPQSQASDTTATGSPDVYTPAAQSEPNKGASVIPSAGSSAYVPVTKSNPMDSSDDASADSSVSVPAVQPKAKGTSGLSLFSGQKNKLRGKDGPSNNAYSSSSRIMSIDDIIYSKEDSFVIINGEVYGLHSVVGGGEIVDISPGKVTIKFGSKKKTYKKRDIIK